MEATNWSSTGPAQTSSLQDYAAPPCRQILFSNLSLPFSPHNYPSLCPLVFKTKTTCDPLTGLVLMWLLISLKVLRRERKSIRPTCHNNGYISEGAGKISSGIPYCLSLLIFILFTHYLGLFRFIYSLVIQARLCSAFVILIRDHPTEIISSRERWKPHSPKPGFEPKNFLLWDISTNH